MEDAAAIEFIIGHLKDTKSNEIFFELMKRNGK